MVRLVASPRRSLFAPPETHGVDGGVATVTLPPEQLDDGSEPITTLATSESKQETSGSASTLRNILSLAEQLSPQLAAVMRQRYCEHETSTVGAHRPPPLHKNWPPSWEEVTVPTPRKILRDDQWKVWPSRPNPPPTPRHRPAPPRPCPQSATAAAQRLAHGSKSVAQHWRTLLDEPTRPSGMSVWERATDKHRSPPVHRPAPRMLVEDDKGDGDGDGEEENTDHPDPADAILLPAEPHAVTLIQSAGAIAAPGAAPAAAPAPVPTAVIPRPMSAPARATVDGRSQLSERSAPAHRRPPPPPLGGCTAVRR
jgi:hypothetical protein